MGQGRWLARVAVLELEQAAQDVQPSPYFAAALMKLAIELRGPAPGALEEAIDRVTEGLPVDRQAFRGYVQRNLSLLRRPQVP